MVIVEITLNAILVNVNLRNFSKTYEKSSSNDANSIQGTSNGGFIVAAYIKSIGAGSYDFWIF